MIIKEDAKNISIPSSKSDLLRPGGGRINSIDAIKCLGILLVIEGHVRGAMGITVYDTLSGLMLYSFNMPIFFFVSGFLAYNDSLNAIEILKKLLQKFLFLVVPAVIFRFFMDLLQGSNPLHILYDGYGKYWFTITLFECFLIYYVVILVLRKKNTQMVVLGIIALIGVCLLSICGEIGPQIIDMNHLTKYFQYFIVGLYAMHRKNLFERIMRNEWIKATALIVFFTLLFIINQLSIPASVLHALRDIVLRYLGTFIIVSFFVCKDYVFDVDTRINKMICLIGRKSLAIYLLQYFFIPNFKTWPQWVYGLDEFTVHVFSFAYTIVITLMCLLFIELLSNSRIIRKYVLGQR